MKIKKLGIVAAAAIMVISVAAPAATTVQASPYSDAFWGSFNGYLAGRAVDEGIQESTRAYHKYKYDKKVYDYKANHATFHIKHKAYIYNKYGRRLGKKYFLTMMVEITTRQSVLILTAALNTTSQVTGRDNLST